MLREIAKLAQNFFSHELQVERIVLNAWAACAYAG
jgi:hypothetical protein